MSWIQCPDAQLETDDSPISGVEQVIVPRTSDIGGFEVARALPSRERRMVGPFVFFDQMGRGEFPPGRGLDVRPHPHIGLSTLTWLFEGALMHRDSLGVEQRIEPGAVNWMTAGRGVVHSERTPEDLRGAGSSMAGMQAWLALPKRLEETEPAFFHHPAETIPLLDQGDWRAQTIVGEAYGMQSPVEAPTQTVYVDLRLRPGARVPIEPVAEERALYLFSGRIRVDGLPGPSNRLLVLRPGSTVMLEADSAVHAMLLGGEPMDGPRYLWWNFVSSSRARIEQAKADWQADRFASVPGEDERIPLPDLPGP